MEQETINVLFVKAPLPELGKLAKKLVERQVPFSSIGIRELRIEVLDYMKPTIDRWLASIEKRCRDNKWAYEQEMMVVPLELEKQRNRV